MLREQVLKVWTELKVDLTEIKDLVWAEQLLSYQADYGNHDQTKLVKIRDQENTLKTINLTSLPKLRCLKILYSLNKEPHLTSLAIKDCANSNYYSSLSFDFSCLWTKTKYFSQVKTLTLHYLPEWCFPRKVIDFSAYSALERLTVEIAHGWDDYQEIIFKAPNLKILDWKGGRNIEKLSGLEQCPRLEIVRIKDATVNAEVGAMLKNHPRYQWAQQNLGEDSWEWVVKSDKPIPPEDEEPVIEEVE